MEFCSLDNLNPNSFWFAPQQYCVSWILLTTSASNAVTEGATLFCTYLTMGSTAQYCYSCEQSSNASVALEQLSEQASA